MEVWSSSSPGPGFGEDLLQRLRGAGGDLISALSSPRFPAGDGGGPRVFSPSLSSLPAPSPCGPWLSAVFW